MRRFSIHRRSAALAISLLIAMPAFANPITVPVAEVTPEAALGALHRNHDWRYVPSVWDGHVGGNRSSWAWTMKIDYNVTKSGRIGYCNVTSSSGNDSFDHAACPTLSRTVRMAPLVDDKGNPKLSKHSLDYSLYDRPGFVCATRWDEGDDTQ